MQCKTFLIFQWNLKVLSLNDYFFNIFWSNTSIAALLRLFLLFYGVLKSTIRESTEINVSYIFI